MTATPTDTTTTARTKPAKLASAGLFTKDDLDYLRRLTARMVALGAWDGAKRFTARDAGMVSDAWLIMPWGGDFGARPEIARECGRTACTMATDRVDATAYDDRAGSPSGIMILDPDHLTPSIYPGRRGEPYLAPAVTPADGLGEGLEGNRGVQQDPGRIRLNLLRLPLSCHVSWTAFWRHAD